MKDTRRVYVLHKMAGPLGKDGKGTLAVGQTFTFPKSGTSYQVQADGSVRRVHAAPAAPQPQR